MGAGRVDHPAAVARNALGRERLRRTPTAASPTGRKAHSARVPRGPPVPIADKTLDGSWDKKLRSGMVEPDRVLDLHGMNLDTRLDGDRPRLEQAIARGDRVLLLITGHHRPGEPPVQRGRIRAAVHDWLAASRHAGDYRRSARRSSPARRRRQPLSRFETRRSRADNFLTPID